MSGRGESHTRCFPYWGRGHFHEQRAGRRVSWKPNVNAEGLAGRAEATQVCKGSRGPGHRLPPPREGLGLRGGSKNLDARRGLKDLFW